MPTDECLKVSLRLARRLKRVVAGYGGGYSEKVRYGKTGDATYEVDEPVEAAVADFFTDLKIPCRVMTEDTGVRDFGEGPKYIFLIDPLDGSRNVRRGLPLYCCSIAAYDIGAKELSDSLCAVIERFDGREEFVARSDGKATLNGKRIHSSKKTAPADAVISMGNHFVSAIPMFADAGRKLGALAKRQQRSIMVKCYGSSALELAYLACGRTDMFYDIRAARGFAAGLKTYDVAAGILICRRAGAVIEYGCKRMPQRLPVDPHVPVQIMGAGNRRLFNTLRNTLR